MSNETPKTTFVKTQKAFVTGETINITYPKPAPKRTTTTNPLTKEQRKELTELVTEWVTHSNLARKPISFPKAWSNLYLYALYGDVNKIDQIEQEEFDTCKKYINERIMIINAGNTKLTRKIDGWRQKHIGVIHKKCKEKSISDEKRKAFMLDKWGKDSLTLLTDDELRECYQYAVSSKSSWIASNYEIKGTQQHREKSLVSLFDELTEHANAVGSTFDRYHITFSKQEVLSMLIQRDRTLWTISGEPMAETSFNKFLTRAKLCKFKSGRK